MTRISRSKNERLMFLFAVGLILLTLAACSTAGGERKKYLASPELQIDPERIYIATLKTEKGDIRIQLFADKAPLTVNNFIFLAEEGFYDKTTFHRVIPGFMAQGGDPTGTGMGTAGYHFNDEFTGHKHDMGVLSMANSGPNTNSAQFFITFVPQHGLDGKHTVFGNLIEGMDILEKLTPRDPTQNPQFKGDTILRITIEER